MIYWERPEGGRVFNSGSIGTGWALLSDTKLQQLLRNVLFHFGVSKNG
jgi:N,N-dimethylformamidase